MCFDGEAPSAERLMRAIGEFKDRAEGRRDADGVVPATCPACGSAAISGSRTPPAWWLCGGCGLEWQTPDPAPAPDRVRAVSCGPCFVLSKGAPGTPPLGVMHLVALYATDNDGFAAVKARLEARRAEEARRRARIAEAEREAEEWWAAQEKAKPWERLALLVMLGVVVWGIYVGWPR